MTAFIDHAERLRIGDMVDLQDDPIADPNCEIGCPFRSQYAKVVDGPEYVNETGIGSHVRLTFHTDTGDVGSEERYERHVFVFPRHHELTSA